MCLLIRDCGNWAFVYIIYSFYFIGGVELAHYSARSDLSKEPIKSGYLCKDVKKNKVFRDNWSYPSGALYERFLLHINFISYHCIQFISAQIDSFRVRSDYIQMYVQIVFHSIFLGGNRSHTKRNIFFTSYVISL